MSKASVMQIAFGPKAVDDYKYVLSEIPILYVV